MVRPQYDNITVSRPEEELDIAPKLVPSTNRSQSSERSCLSHFVSLSWGNVTVLVVNDAPYSLLLQVTLILEKRKDLSPNHFHQRFLWMTANKRKENKMHCSWSMKELNLAFSNTVHWLLRDRNASPPYNLFICPLCGSFPCIWNMH